MPRVLCAGGTQQRRGVPLLIEGDTNMDNKADCIAIHKTKRHQWSERKHRLVGFLLAVIVPLGLARLWMGRRLWWLHPLLCGASIAANYQFLFVYAAENADAARQITDYASRLPHFFEYPSAWWGVVSFTLNSMWLLLITYDMVMTMYWPVPEGSTNDAAAVAQESDHA